MTLRAPIFSGIPELQRIADGTSNLTPGARGLGVQAIQEGLLILGFPLPVTTLRGTAPPDGLYGKETLAAVREFQLRKRLPPADGILGSDELAALDLELAPQAPAQVDSHHHCGNCYAETGIAPSLTGLQNGATNGNGKHPLLGKIKDQARQFGAGMQRRADGIKKKVNGLVNGMKAIDVPNSVLPLEEFLERDPAWLRAVDQTFGASLDYGNIFVNNGLGFDGRQFVMFLPVPHFLMPKVPRQAKGILLVQMGPFTTLKTDILLHELTHCWQSQHSRRQIRFMKNAVASQRAGAKNGGSAYAYQFAPPKAFKEYGAEQIAQQVQNGVQFIIDHIRAVKPWAIDPDLELSLATPKWDDNRRSNVTE
ncbi:MAG TPA: peptidoglycan-binding domain-containing protein [Gemmatales bacterium]|nr:peptidoglycan-binding domain-containing protein [Gemmatales bacterium]HMP61335.1 peptidoglycan-binding domain-containing protein [Gemmatales bacterium]